MKRSAVIAWCKYYFACGKCECIIWAVAILFFTIVGFSLSLLIAIETYASLETVPPLRGSGSDFAIPLYDEWFNSLYVNEGIQVTYQEDSVHNALDALHNSSNSFTFAGGELSWDSGPPNNTLQFPIVGASVLLVFNVPPLLDKNLNITMDAIIEIYNGSISHWNDTILAALNPLASLPPEKIVPLHYLKDSGATYIFTSTLSDYSTWWAENVGSGERVKFPKAYESTTPVFDDYDMLETLLQVPYSVGYVTFPTMKGFNVNVFESNFTEFTICTVVNNGTCVHNVTLDEELQERSLSSFVIDSNGAAIAPPYNWTCTDCWFFNGYTYWYTEEQYSLQSCKAFVMNLNTLFTWIYTDPTAIAEARSEHFYLPQEAWVGLQTNIERIGCADSASSVLDYAFFAAWLVVMGIFFCFACMIGIRVSVGVFKRYRRVQQNPVTLSLQAEGPMEITPLLMTAQIDRKDIVLKEQIGTGSFGEVYKGVWRGSDVAVKRMLIGNEPNQRTVIEDFFQEANLMSTLRHPNVIQFLGASLITPHLYIVLELADRGSVYDLLSRNDVTLNWTKKMNFCMDAAKGMLYLHSSNPPIIHRDLKTANLLVDQNWRVKVTDFGLSRVVDTQTTMTHCGTVEFCAPEVLKRSRYSVKADVYSYGICVWQIFTRSALFHNTPLYQLMRMVVHDRYRPPLDDKIFPSPMKHLIEKCWAHDPNDRPEFDVILADLIHIQEKSKNF